MKAFHRPGFDSKPSTGHPPNRTLERNRPSLSRRGVTTLSTDEISNFISQSSCWLTWRVEAERAGAFSNPSLQLDLALLVRFGPEIANGKLFACGNVFLSPNLESSSLRKPGRVWVAAVIDHAEEGFETFANLNINSSETVVVSYRQVARSPELD